MIEELATLLDTFPGPANQTRCFLHIVNLVAKSVLRQFEPHKAKGNDVLSEGAQELAALSTDLEHSDGDGDGEDGDSDDEDDDLDGFKDERDGMSEEEIATLEQSVQPVRLVLAKASYFKLRFDNSTTIVLPEWNSTLKELELDPRMMPRDVSTRWNSTFDMLDFAVQYRPAIDAITDNRDMKMRKLELDGPDWIIARQLRDTLKVSPSFLRIIALIHHFCADL
ncbi:hypothetical protein BDZ97DRAFT_1660813 [Flammula alnicola]|nr:hypothetical protein BDZ97DRAFT_1660813 [Flammula alnicola]